MSPGIFVVASRSSLRALPYWLEERDWNEHVEDCIDKNGKFFVGLRLRRPGAMESNKIGIVLMHRQWLYRPALEIIRHCAAQRVRAA